MKLHRDNVRELELTNYTYRFNGFNDHGNPQYLTEAHINKQRQVFHHIVKDFEDAYEELSFLFEGIQITDLYESDYLVKIKSNETISKRKIDPIVLGKMESNLFNNFFWCWTGWEKNYCRLNDE